MAPEMGESLVWIHLSLNCVRPTIFTAQWWTCDCGVEQNISTGQQSRTDKIKAVASLSAKFVRVLEDYPNSQVGAIWFARARSVYSQRRCSYSRTELWEGSRPTVLLTVRTLPSSDLDWRLTSIPTLRSQFRTSTFRVRLCFWCPEMAGAAQHVRGGNSDDWGEGFGDERGVLLLMI